MSNDGQDMTPPIPSSSEVSLGVRIDRICGEFENLLKAGKTPSIEGYLAELPADHHALLLEELLGLELDYRAKAGDSFTSEEYVVRFPQYASTVSKLVVNVRQKKPAEPQAGETKAQSAATPKSQQSPGSSNTTANSQPTSRPVRIGPYEIIEPCGRGGMGVVYKAWHEFFKQYRAIKVLPSHFDEDDINRFAMEIKIAGQLNHHNIVRAYEANREQGILYLAMEFVDGINLDHLVKHHKRIPLGLACELIRQAAEGLQHADDHDLVHRDIKPSNLMINQNGQVKILDFGLARLQADQNASRLTKHGSVMGTLDFMAPEQWEDPMGATIQADIYSLGCTLYYLVTGTPPYGGEDYSHWIKKQEAHRTKPVPQLEHEQGELLQPIINRMMAKSPHERYECPAEIAEALGPLSDVTELKTYAKTPPPKVAPADFSRTPIPTVNVSSTDLLGSQDEHRVREKFSPDDSERNSKEKTLRPHQSRTDLESDLRPATTAEPQPSKRGWYQTRPAWISLAVLAVVLLSGAWYFFRPIPNQELAQQMGALPGLNGGLNGDWWFAEMPWYAPGIREAFMEALRSGESQIAGIPLTDWEARLRDSDTQSLQNDLKKMADELRSRLPDNEQSLVGPIFNIQPDIPNYDEILLNVLPEDYREGEIDKSLLESASATELHFMANLLHHASTNNSAYASKAEQVYNAAINAYDEMDEVQKTLQALARSDYSRFLAGRRDYSRGIYEAKRAAEAVPHAALFQISLRCDMADQHRKLDGDSTRALLQLSGRDDSAQAWAERMQLAAYHPLQAEMRERRGWINIDGWQMEQALKDFEEATNIRIANQKQGNTFAWRPRLLNMQGRAMALHFLGRDEGNADENGNEESGAIPTYHKLVEIIDEPPQGLPWGTDKERFSRLPNIHERHGDVYLFDHSGKFDYKQAEEELQKAQLAAERQGFGNSATLWFHLARLYYKHALAMILQGDSAILEDGAGKNKTPLDYARELKTKYEQQIQDAEAFKKQSQAFAQEEKVTEALLRLKQVEQGTGTVDPDQVEQAVEKLQALIETTDTTNVNRANIEVLLLVIRELLNHRDKLEPRQINTLGYKLWEFTKSMREGDPEITNDYLRPVLQQAHDAIDELPDDKEDAATKANLSKALPEMATANQ